MRRGQLIWSALCLTLALMLALGVEHVQAQIQPQSKAKASPASSADSRRQGSSFMGEQTQAMQRDDTQNPAMLWVKDGEAMWSQPPTSALAGQKASATADSKSCAACHGNAERSMRGVAARYPAFDAPSGQPVNLAQRINLCRERQQKQPAWKMESQELLAMESYLALQSRGMPLQAPVDARLRPHVDSGARRFEQRIGQINLSCAQCHDANWGRSLGGALIPQGHPTGYPLYRLEWQGVGSLQRRLRNCMTGVRAEAHALGSLELVEIELFLAHRARGMAMEAPGVRP